MSEDTSVGGKVNAVIEKVKSLDVKSALKKSVTVPVKVLVIGGAVVIVLALALSLSRRVEPQVSSLLWNDPPTKALDVMTAAAAVQGLKEHITATCKPSSASSKTEAKKVK